MHRALAPLLLAALPAPALADAILPLDGTWVTQAEVVEIDHSCPDELRPMLSAVAAQTAQEQTRQLTFGDTFDPAAMEGGTGAMEWSRQTRNTWRGLMNHDDPAFAEFGMLDLTVVAPDMMRSILVFDIAAMLRPGNPDLAEEAAGCTIEARLVTRHQG